MTPGALITGLRVDLLPIHIHNQYKKVPLDQKPVPSPLLPYPLRKKRRPNVCVEGDVGDTNAFKQPTTSGKLTDRALAPVRAALVLEGSVCADQGPDPPWLRGLAKAHV